MAGQPQCAAPPKVPSLWLPIAPASPTASSGLSTRWAAEADPGLACCWHPLLLPRTGCAPTVPGPSSPAATVPAAVQCCHAAVLTMLRCLAMVSREFRAQNGARLSQEDDKPSAMEPGRAAGQS